MRFEGKISFAEIDLQLHASFDSLLSAPNKSYVLLHRTHI